MSGIPTNPTDRKAFKDAIYEASGALQIIDDKRSFIKDIADTMKEKYDIEPKYFRKIASAFHKNDGKLLEETETISQLYEVVTTSDTSENGDSDEEA